MPTNTITEAPPLPGQRGHKDKLKTLPQGSRKRQGRARDRLRKEKKEHQEWSGIATHRPSMHAGMNEYLNK